VLVSATFINWLKAGLVTVDNNLGWQVIDPEPQTLPAQRLLGAVSLQGLPQTAEYTFGGPYQYCNAV